MAVGERITDPYANFRFKVEIEGLTVGGFSEVSGLAVELEAEDFQEGGVNGYAHKLPKLVKNPNIVLKRGLTDSDTLWKWQNSIGKDKTKVSRKTVRVILLDSQLREKISWRCLSAFPLRWTGPTFEGASANT